MRKYLLGSLVVIVSIGGLFYPYLGYFLLLVFVTLLAIAPFMGRWFCGNLCPRGAFNDTWLPKLSAKKKIPRSFRSMYIRIPVFILLMGFMVFRLLQAQGAAERIGMVFVSMCLVTTSIAVIFGTIWSPRAWCSFCPMGTVQAFLGRGRHQLKVDSDKCVSCSLCDKACPMQLCARESSHDCIKCRRCVAACPKDALSF